METNVAIIIANYNYGHYLMDGIESIRKQTYKGPIQIYLVDDGSSDDSWDKICEITEPDSSEDVEEGHYTGPIESRNGENLFAYRINNSGASTARNVAIHKAWAWADVFGILDADDQYKSHKVEVLLQKLLEYTEIGVAYGDYDIHRVFGDKNYMKYEFKQSYDREELLNRCMVHSNALIKRSALASVKLQNGEYFDSRLHGPGSQNFIGCTEDYDLWLRLSKLCMITHVPESLAIAVESGQNQSMKMTSEIFMQNAEILKTRQ